MCPIISEHGVDRVRNRHDQSGEKVGGDPSRCPLVELGESVFTGSVDFEEIEIAVLGPHLSDIDMEAADGTCLERLDSDRARTVEPGMRLRSSPSMEFSLKLRNKVWPSIISAVFMAQKADKHTVAISASTRRTSSGSSNALRGLSRCRTSANNSQTAGSRVARRARAA